LTLTHVKSCEYYHVLADLLVSKMRRTMFCSIKKSAVLCKLFYFHIFQVLPFALTIGKINLSCLTMRTQDKETKLSKWFTPIGFVTTLMDQLLNLPIIPRARQKKQCIQQSIEHTQHMTLDLLWQRYSWAHNLSPRSPIQPEQYKLIQCSLNDVHKNLVSTDTMEPIHLNSVALNI
jgi:hypothetical protein